MSLILAACALAAIAASASGGYWAALRRRAKEEETPRDKGDKGASKGDKGASKVDKGATSRAKKRATASAFAGLPLSLGDVVVADREERWLAGGLLAKEGDRVVAALFFAPEGALVKMVAAFPEPRRELLWLDGVRVDSPPEPPGSIEIEGVPMTRRGRLPVVLSRHGQGAPNVGETGILAEYEGGADEVAVLVTTEGRSFAWRGRRLADGQYDRLGSGGDDP